MYLWLNVTDPALQAKFLLYKWGIVRTISPITGGLIKHKGPSWLHLICLWHSPEPTQTTEISQTNEFGSSPYTFPSAFFGIISSKSQNYVRRGKKSISKPILQMKQLRSKLMDSSASSHVASEWWRNNDNPLPLTPTSVILAFWALSFIKQQEITCPESIRRYNQAKIKALLHHFSSWMREMNN